MLDSYLINDAFCYEIEFRYIKSIDLPYYELVRLDCSRAGSGEYQGTMKLVVKPSAF
jgi:hypothetical protein